MSVYFSQKEKEQNLMVINTISGALSGAVTAIFICPLDVVKTRLQVMGLVAQQQQGFKAAVRDVIKVDGVKGLYRGLSPTIFSLLPNWAVYFTVYNKMKKVLTDKVLKGNYESIDSQQRVHHGSALVHILSASVAGVATNITTNPLWVVKSRLQTQSLQFNIETFARSKPYTGTFNALSRLAREEGLSGLYSGLAPSLVGVAHVMIQLPLYEQLKDTLLNSHKNREKNELSTLEYLLASSLSKVVASVSMYPHEVLRTHMHVRGQGPQIGPLISTFKEIMLKDGIPGFYRGIIPNLLRAVPGAAITFTSYELLNKFLISQSNLQQQRKIDQKKQEQNHQTNTDQQSQLLNGLQSSSNLIIGTKKFNISGYPKDQQNQQQQQEQQQLLQQQQQQNYQQQNQTKDIKAKQRQDQKQCLLVNDILQEKEQSDHKFNSFQFFVQPLKFKQF